MLIYTIRIGARTFILHTCIYYYYYYHSNCVCSVYLLCRYLSLVYCCCCCCWCRSESLNTKNAFRFLRLVRILIVCSQSNVTYTFSAKIINCLGNFAEFIYFHFCVWFTELHLYGNFSPAIFASFFSSSLSFFVSQFWCMCSAKIFLLTPGQNNNNNNNIFPFTFYVFRWNWNWNERKWTRNGNNMNTTHIF